MNCLLRIFLIISAVSSIHTQNNENLDEVYGKPEKCEGDPRILTEQCCLLPPFFARDVAKECGAMYAVINNDFNNNITYRSRHLLDGCDTWTCILTQYRLVTKDNKVDDEKYYAHLDRWVELNPDFADIMAKVKGVCKELAEPYLPLRLCQFTSLQKCLRQAITQECPVLKNSEVCLKQKAYFDECREYQ